MGAMFRFICSVLTVGLTAHYQTARSFNTSSEEAPYIAKTSAQRAFTLKLDILSPGTHRMTAFKDGLNAGYQAMLYNKVEKNVDYTQTVDIYMASNGSWAAVIE